MDTRLKQRLVGAVVVVALIVVFLPELLRPSSERESEVREFAIPDRPDPVTGGVELPQPIGIDGDADSDSLASLPEISQLPQTNIVEEVVEIDDSDQAQAPDSSTVMTGQPDENAISGQTSDVAAPALVESSGSTTERAGWVVQVGSFSRPDNATMLKARLQDSGFDTFVQKVDVGGRTMFRVRIGPESDRQKAENITKRLSEILGMTGQIRRHP